MQLIQYKKLFQIHFHFQWTDPIPMFPGSSRTWQYQYINIDININIETNININISGSSGTWQTLSQQRSAPAAQAPRCRSPSVCWKRKTRLVSQKKFFSWKMDWQLLRLFPRQTCLCSNWWSWSNVWKIVNDWVSPSTIWWVMSILFRCWFTQW